MAYDVAVFANIAYRSGDDDQTDSRAGTRQPDTALPPAGTIRTLLSSTNSVQLPQVSAPEPHSTHWLQKYFPPLAENSFVVSTFPGNCLCLPTLSQLDEGGLLNDTFM